MYTDILETLIDPKIKLSYYFVYVFVISKS